MTGADSRELWGEKARRGNEGGYGRVPLSDSILAVGSVCLSGLA